MFTCRSPPHSSTCSHEHALLFHIGTSSGICSDDVNAGSRPGTGLRTEQARHPLPREKSRVHRFRRLLTKRLCPTPKSSNCRLPKAAMLGFLFYLLVAHCRCFFSRGNHSSHVSHIHIDRPHACRGLSTAIASSQKNELKYFFTATCTNPTVSEAAMLDTKRVAVTTSRCPSCPPRHRAMSAWRDPTIGCCPLRVSKASSTPQARVLATNGNYFVWPAPSSHRPDWLAWPASLPTKGAQQMGGGTAQHMQFQRRQIGPCALSHPHPPLRKTPSATALANWMCARLFAG